MVATVIQWETKWSPAHQVLKLLDVKFIPQPYHKLQKHDFWRLQSVSSSGKATWTHGVLVTNFVSYDSTHPIAAYSRWHCLSRGGVSCLHTLLIDQGVLCSTEATSTYAVLHLDCKLPLICPCPSCICLWESCLWLLGVEMPLETFLQWGPELPAL